VQEEPDVSEKYISSIFRLLPAFAGFLLGLLFGPEDGADMFLRIVVLPSKYMAL
jgi:hypothetical protein